MFREVMTHTEQLHIRLGERRSPSGEGNYVVKRRKDSRYLFCPRVDPFAAMGVSYSAVSRRVRTVERRLAADRRWRVRLARSVRCRCQSQDLIK